MDVSVYTQTSCLVVKFYWSCRSWTDERRSLKRDGRGRSFLGRGKLWLVHQATQTTPTPPSLKFLVGNFNVIQAQNLILHCGRGCIRCTNQVYSTTQPVTALLCWSNVLQISVIILIYTLFKDNGYSPQVGNWAWISSWTGCRRWWWRLVEWLTFGTRWRPVCR